MKPIIEVKPDTIIRRVWSAYNPITKSDFLACLLQPKKGQPFELRGRFRMHEDSEVFGSKDPKLPFEYPLPTDNGDMALAMCAPLLTALAEEKGFEEWDHVDFTAEENADVDTVVAKLGELKGMQIDSRQINSKEGPGQ